MCTEEQLRVWCHRLKASDRQAYEQVFRTLHGALFRYACYITSDAAAARDLTQDVFLQLWEMREALDPNRSLEALLYRMVRNRAYNYQRDRRTRTAKHVLLKTERTDDRSGPERPDATLGAKVLDEKLQAWVNELPARQREALSLSRFEGLSHEEIAAVMDISPRTVNNHVVRALKTLRNRVHAFEPDLLA